MDVGYIGPPPLINAPELFGAFAEAYPDAAISFREIPFPYSPTHSWLEAVDVAFTHSPAGEPGICIQAVRTEPRAIIAPDTHPLAGRTKLSVGDVLDEVFLGYHPDVQPAWAAFHSLDDHRGAPARLTTDRARTPPEMLAMIASRQALAALPLSDAHVIERVLRSVVAIPLTDADPAVLSISSREGDHNPCVQALAGLAGQVAGRNGAITGPAAAVQPRH
jgi:hypothetical protein